MMLQYVASSVFVSLDSIAEPDMLFFELSNQLACQYFNTSNHQDRLIFSHDSLHCFIYFTLNPRNATFYCSSYEEFLNVLRDFNEQLDDTTEKQQFLFNFYSTNHTTYMDAIYSHQLQQH